MKRIRLLILGWALLALAVSCQSRPTAKNSLRIQIAPELVEADAGAYVGTFFWAKLADGQWGVFYNHIEGFEFEKGYEYVLQVRRDTVPNPAQDASSLKYTLIEVVSKEYRGPS